MAEPLKVPWEETPAGYLDRLRDLVEREHVSSARELVQEARRRYPKDPALARWHDLLSPAKLLKRGPASGVDRTAEIQWLDSHGAAYRGEWVALSGERLLGHSRNLQELRGMLERSSADQRPFLHYIPE